MPDNATGRIDTLPASTIEALLALADKSEELLALLETNANAGGNDDANAGGNDDANDGGNDGGNEETPAGT